MRHHIFSTLRKRVMLAGLLTSLALISCGGGNESSAVIPPNVTGPNTGTTSTAGVLCNYGSTLFNSSASVNATSTSAWSCTANTRVLAANGIPDHAVGGFPNANNPNTISAQTVAASYTLTPTQAAAATTLGGPRGAIGYVLNGVKIDPSTAGSCDNGGTRCSPIGNLGPWSIEALGQRAFNFGTDTNNAHVQPDGAYHYHGIPEGYLALRGGGPSTMTLIAWAADGFPIYARYGYSVADDANSALKRVISSYRLKAVPEATRPPVSAYPMGTFQQDYEYVAGLGDLDECNGRIGVTPEFPNGIYHYYGTDSYPFLQRCVRGTVTP